MGREELAFTIYCAGILAERLEITEREAYHLLCKGDIVDGYQNVGTDERRRF